MPRLSPPPASIDDLFDPSAAFAQAQLDALIATDPAPRQPVVTPPPASPQLQPPVVSAPAPVLTRPLETTLDRELLSPVGPALTEDLIAAGLRRSRAQSIVLWILVVALVGVGVWWRVVLEREASIETTPRSGRQ